jgi:hypothetical protein
LMTLVGSSEGSEPGHGLGCSFWHVSSHLLASLRLALDPTLSSGWNLPILYSAIETRLSAGKHGSVKSGVKKA